MERANSSSDVVNVSVRFRDSRVAYGAARYCQASVSRDFLQNLSAMNRLMLYGTSANLRGRGTTRVSASSSTPRASAATASATTSVSVNVTNIAANNTHNASNNSATATRRGRQTTTNNTTEKAIIVIRDSAEVSRDSVVEAVETHVDQLRNQHSSNYDIIEHSSTTSTAIDVSTTTTTTTKKAALSVGMKRKREQTHAASATENTTNSTTITNNNNNTVPTITHTTKTSQPKKKSTINIAQDNRSCNQSINNTYSSIINANMDANSKSIYHPNTNSSNNSYTAVGTNTSDNDNTVASAVRVTDVQHKQRLRWQSILLQHSCRTPSVGHTIYTNMNTNDPNYNIANTNATNEEVQEEVWRLRDIGCHVGHIKYFQPLELQQFTTTNNTSSYEHGSNNNKSIIDNCSSNCVNSANNCYTGTTTTTTTNSDNTYSNIADYNNYYYIGNDSVIDASNTSNTTHTTANVVGKKRGRSRSNSLVVTDTHSENNTNRHCGRVVCRYEERASRTHLSHRHHYYTLQQKHFALSSLTSHNNYHHNNTYNNTSNTTTNNINSNRSSEGVTDTIIPPLTSPEHISLAMEQQQRTRDLQYNRLLAEVRPRLFPTANDNDHRSNGINNTNYGNSYNSNTYNNSNNTIQYIDTISNINGNSCNSSCNSGGDGGGDVDLVARVADWETALLHRLTDFTA